MTPKTWLFHPFSLYTLIPETFGTLKSCLKPNWAIVSKVQRSSRVEKWGLNFLDRCWWSREIADKKRANRTWKIEGKSRFFEFSRDLSSLPKPNFQCRLFMCYSVQMMSNNPQKFLSWFFTFENAKDNLTPPLILRACRCFPIRDFYSCQKIVWYAGIDSL